MKMPPIIKIHPNEEDPKYDPKNEDNHYGIFDSWLLSMWQFPEWNSAKSLYETFFWLNTSHFKNNFIFMKAQNYSRLSKNTWIMFYSSSSSVFKSKTFYKIFEKNAFDRAPAKTEHNLRTKITRRTTGAKGNKCLQVIASFR